jgi:hypothetical protein
MKHGTPVSMGIDNREVPSLRDINVRQRDHVQARVPTVMLTVAVESAEV